MACAVARRYRGRGIADEDLQQVACLALVRAVRRFDAGHDRDFLAFAVPTMSGEIKRYFRDHGWMVRPPRRVQELRARALALRSSTREDELPLGDHDLAARLEVGVEDLREALGASGCFSPDSLDRTTGDQPHLEMADPGSEGAMDSLEARVTLGPLLRVLDERERVIVQLVYAEGWLQREVAEHLDITQAQVSRLLVRILTKMRERAGLDLTPAAA
ncbi:RNA polymerase sigma factor [Nocardioides psychrotolerans]|nr:RNA polymerase sigma factor [Nocardioides psychrotolerans]